MKRLFIILTFIVLSCSENKNEFETYNELEQTAMLQFINKEYDNALINFQKAIDIKPNKNVSLYFYATASALNLGNLNKAKELIISSIHNTNASKEYFLNFEEFNNFRNEKLFLDIENEYDKHIEQFYKKLENPKIYREIDSLRSIDKKVRTDGSGWDEISRIDSLNINRLIEITKKYGWQERSWIILWHQRGTFGEYNYIWNFFKPYIDEQIELGKIEKSFWTIFEEEKYISENNKQIYGLYSNQFDQFPINDIDNVDKRRIENGLPPLWYMKKVYGIELPVGYKNTVANNSYKQ